METLCAAACVFCDDGSQLPDEFWQLKNWSDTLRNKSWCGGRRFFFMAAKQASKLAAQKGGGSRWREHQPCKLLHTLRGCLNASNCKVHTKIRFVVWFQERQNCSAWQAYQSPLRIWILDRNIKDDDNTNLASSLTYVTRMSWRI